MSTLALNASDQLHGAQVREEYDENVYVDVGQSLRSMFEKETRVSDGQVSPKLSLPPPPRNSRFFISSSLSNSATSSPRFGHGLMKNIKKWGSHSLSGSPLSSVKVSPFAVQEGSHLRRSKSYAEGRTSVNSDVFDLWPTNVSSPKHKYGDNIKSYEGRGDENVRRTKKELGNSYDEGFKCGTLCVFLPGFGKGKPVRSVKDEGVANMQVMISRTVSLEKFECGSWASSPIINEGQDEERESGLFFDLPLELIRCGGNDAHSPVGTAFVFEADRRGALKKCTSKGTGGKPHESSGRQVRFSVSSSPSFSPRLLKAREDFNAYLEAQGA
ncbi:hypothetical protein GIB67_016125 [Kingdonia uniflora]|uniref:Uncharacterized protein n=1 Tax=Kingdonia uniflora TaxID=39325 RepID=A0A7J7L258_9MAGN|nr:hypothetical protein GIB67_016125 [Kingdonia uniflora]